jgi:CelD/BcsL family acetyltransferase involved in cellulose biosynthesis
MNKLKLEIREGEKALQLLGKEWRTLYTATAAVPFLSWEWAVTWYRWFGAGQTPYLLCVYDGAQLSGLLALVSARQGVPALPLQMRRISFLGSGFGGADYLDILAFPGLENKVAEMMWEHLVKTAGFELLELDDLAADSPTAAHFVANQNHRFRCSLASRYRCPQIQLKGDWNAVLKRSRRAENFKRRLRQLSTREGFAHRIVTQPEEAQAAFERFLQLHEARWMSAGGSEMTGHERLVSFHRELVVRFAKVGLLRFDELWVEGACRASIYGIEHGRQYFFYNSGYDQAWRGASVGLVLLGLSIKSAIERGIEVYDFLRGTEGYKFDWATTTRETLMIRVAPKRAYATLLLAYEQGCEAMRQGVREMLPTWLLQPAQRVRRAWKRNHELNDKVIFSQQIEEG